MTRSTKPWGSVRPLRASSVFKYYNFVNAGAFNFLNYWNIRWPLPEITWLLPIGISFYTFMAIGYSVDVYNEEIKAEKNLGVVALFLAFFPILLSGPIERELPTCFISLKIGFCSILIILKKDFN